MSLNALPEDCICKIISFTSPRDACTCSLVSKNLRSAAGSDAVWESFLPPDCRTIVPELLLSVSRKELYRALCDSHVLIDDGRRSFSLVKSSGKKCYMLSARDLSIAWQDEPRYWKWISHPKSRFPEVAELRSVCWFDISSKINTRVLSENTIYAAYFVFVLKENAYGFDYPMELSVRALGGGVCKKVVSLKPGAPSTFAPNAGECSYARNDGWLEIELGDFFVGDDAEDEMDMSVKEVKRLFWKKGLIVHGIEVRPKKFE